MARVLIVEDSSFFRFVCGKYLEKIGHTVVGEAENRKTALDLYKSLSPDLVILDVILDNDDDGIDVLKDIISLDSEAKIIMCTSEANKNKIFQAKQAGAGGYLVKPLEGKTFKSTIDKILNV